MAARRAGIVLAGWLLAATAAGAAEDPGYEWMTVSGDRSASLVFGSPETGEDYVFAVTCRIKGRGTDLTVYVDIAGTKVGAPVAIEFSAGADKLSVPGKISTDEMSGYLFAEANSFKIDPVIAMLNEEGPVRVKTGAVVTNLPNKGRANAVAAFAKSCSVD